MPYIRCSTSVKLSDEQKTGLKEAFGAAMPLIPGKTEAALMVELADGVDMYFQGRSGSFAFIDAVFSGHAEFSDQKRLAEALIAAVCEVCGLSEQDVYLTYAELNSWGSKGTLWQR